MALGALGANSLGCGPRQAWGLASPGTTRGDEAITPRPLPPKEAAALAGLLEKRSLECFEAIFKESFDRDIPAPDKADLPRQRRAAQALGRELDACLRGEGYGGHPSANASTVRRWLSEKSCEGFSRSAFRSKECFVLQIVLEEAGFPLALPHGRPPGSKVSGNRPKGPAPIPADGVYRASHILIFYAGAQRAPTSVTRSRADALLLATRVGNLARATGASFAALARQHSECSSASKGGDLGRFQLNQMVPSFSAAVRNLHPDEISSPVETPFGYHVIQRH